MTDKSHVSLERHICFICGKAHDTGAILIDRRLRNSLERQTTTGYGLCPEHQRLFDEGFVALVECDPEKSGKPSSGGTLQPSEAYRTGRLAYLRREEFSRVFNIAIAPDLPYVFVEPGVMEKLSAASRVARPEGDLNISEDDIPY